MSCKVTYSSPLGTIVIESDGECLTGLRFADDADGAADTPQVSVLTQTIQWLDDYFAGRQPRNIPPLNPRGTAFQRRVWQALFTIDYGQTKTYGEIARLVECRCAQAIGQALTRNPIAIIIPCHRVIAAHGALGGYGSGIERKQFMLEQEAASCN